VPRVPPLAQVAAGALLLSFAPVFVRIARVGPTTAGFYRMALAGVVLVAVLAIRRERPWSGRVALGFAVAAGVWFALDLFFWHKAIHLIGPGLATIIANFQVFLLAAYGALVLRERVTWRLGVAIPLALCGLFLLVGVEWRALPPGYRWGVILGLLTAVSYASFLLTLRASQRRTRRLEPIPNLMIICAVTALLLGAGAPLAGESLAVPDPSTGLVLVAYAISAQVVGWLLISRGIPHVEAGRAGLMLLLQPSLAFVWDVLFFDRPTDIADVLGAAMALGAIYLGTGGKDGGRAVGR
jgi:drug/metabolite transporter (DMT)-like permease